MASVITNFIVSIWILVKGILLALLDMVAAVWHLIRDINLGFYHIFKGIVGFLWTNIFLIAVLGGGYYAYITYINPEAKQEIASAARANRPAPVTPADSDKKAS